MHDIEGGNLFDEKCVSFKTKLKEFQKYRFASYTNAQPWNAFYIWAVSHEHTYATLLTRTSKDHFFTTSINFDLNTIKHVK